MMCLPVSIPPVNDTKSTSSWPDITSPTSEPAPRIKLIVPLGNQPLPLIQIHELLLMV